MTVGDSPRGISAGDLDGDGDIDLTVANVYGDSVSLLLGNGSGGFTAGTPVGTGDNTRSVALGDFNGDGVLDLVASNENDDNVSIRLGQRNATTQLQLSTVGIVPGYAPLNSPFTVKAKALTVENLRDSLYRGTVRVTVDGKEVPLNLPHSIGSRLHFDVTDDGEITFPLTLSTTGNHTIRVTDTLLGTVFGELTLDTIAPPTFNNTPVVTAQEDNDYIEDISGTAAAELSLTYGAPQLPDWLTISPC